MKSGLFVCDFDFKGCMCGRHPLRQFGKFTETAFHNHCPELKGKKRQMGENILSKSAIKHI